MPTYEYECNACSHAFEALQTMTEPKLTKCPQCGKEKLSRLIGSGSGVIFKGTGFYETDYKKKEAPKVENKPASSCASCPMQASGGCS
jgi:putative FmdB family regulatory protein